MTPSIQSTCSNAGRFGLLGLLVLACGGNEAPPAAPVLREGPDDAILRIGSTWRAQINEKGNRSKPSPITSFNRQISTQIVLSAGARTVPVTEDVHETFVLASGETIECATSSSYIAEAAYGLKNGESALQLGWASATHPRNCSPPNAAIPPLKRAAGRALFALRSDRLVAVEPALEKRQFIPVD